MTVEIEETIVKITEEIIAWTREEKIVLLTKDKIVLSIKEKIVVKTEEIFLKIKKIEVTDPLKEKELLQGIVQGDPRLLLKMNHYLKKT